MWPLLVFKMKWVHKVLLQKYSQNWHVGSAYVYQLRNEIDSYITVVLHQVTYFGVRYGH